VNNPLDWLPEAGKSKEIPNGVMWCQSWEVVNSKEYIEGEIVLKFAVKREPDAIEQKQESIIES